MVNIKSNTSHLLEKNFFRVSKFSLKLLGFWPEQKVNVILIFKVIINWLILAWIAGCEFVYVLLNINDLILAFDALCPAITQIITALKLFIIYYNRKQFTNIISRVAVLWLSEKNEEKIKFMTRIESTANTFVFVLFTFGNLTSLLFVSRPIVGAVFDHINGQNITWELPFKLFLPYDGFSSPGYEITSISLAYVCIITVCGFAGCDGLFFSFCLYISGLFKGVEFDLEKSLNGQDRKFTTEENDYILRKVRHIIYRQNIINNLCGDFTSLYTTIILAHFLSAAIVICLSSIDLILSNGYGAALYINYNMAALTQLFVYCAGGNYVSESSKNIAKKIYFSDWYECDKRLQKSLLLIMMRSQKGTELVVPFFVPSLPLFGTILSTAGSYITLLKTFL